MHQIGQIELMGQRIGVFEQQGPGTDGGPSYQLIDNEGERWATLSTRLPDVTLDRGEFLAKTWG